MKEMFNLRGKAAIVTGGNGGIGKGIARGFAAMGGDIVIAARNQAKTGEAVKEIKEEFGVRVLGVQADVRRQDQVQAMVNQALDAYGRIDILVNNAGIANAKMPQDYTLAEWNEVLETNLSSAFLCSTAVYPAMKSAGGGKIICIGSMYSIFGGHFTAPYGASKGGIVQLTRSLAVAWAADNIQVNAILPGWIMTDILKKALGDFPGADQLIISRTPGGRLGDPADLAGTAVFLASRASDFVTGVALPVDGGFSVSA